MVRSLVLAALLLLVPGAAVAGSAEPNTLEATLRSLPFAASWRSIQTFLDPADLKSLHAPLQEILATATAAGYRALPEYSEELLAAAYRELRAGRVDEARYLVHEALLLSPNSPSTLLAAVPLMRPTRAGSEAEILARFFLSLFGSPKAMLQAFVILAYPCAMALTLGLVGVGLALLIVRLPQLRRRLQAELPNALRGYLEAPLLALGVVVPLFYGPLITLALWTLVITVLSQRREWFAFYVGGVLCLWGALIPLRENSAALLRDPRFHALLEVLAGEYRASHAMWAEQTVRVGPEGGAEWYALGQHFQRAGDLLRAEDAFRRAEIELAGDPWPTAQRGLIAAVRGDFDSSFALLEEARARGADSAGVLFHLSRVSFERSDTIQSRTFDTAARRADPELVETLHQRESVAPAGVAVVADMPLPARHILEAFLTPARGMPPVDDAIARRLTVWCTPVHLMGIGALFVLLFFVCGDGPGAHRAVGQAPSCLLRLLPGGALVARGRLSSAVLCLGLLLCLATPLSPVAGPVYRLWELVPGGYVLYASVLGLFAFLFWYSGFVSVEE